MKYISIDKEVHSAQSLTNLESQLIFRACEFNLLSKTPVPVYNYIFWGSAEYVFLNQL